MRTLEAILVTSATVICQFKLCFLSVQLSKFSYTVLELIEKVLE